MKKFILNILIFKLIFLGLIILLLNISNYLNNKAKPFEYNSNIINVFAGDSHITYAINDNIIDNSVNVAKRAESFFYTYYKLNNLLQLNPKVKNIYLGFGCHSVSPFFDETLINGENSISVMDHFFYLPMGIQLKYIFTNINVFPKFVKNKFQNKSFFGYTNNSHPTCVNANAVKKRISFFYQRNGVNKYSEKNIKYLHKIRELCNDYNCNLVLIETPIHHSHYNQIPKLYIDRFNNIIENNGYELINMCNIELGDSCYNPDGDHLSGKGSELVSNYLKEKFINKQ